MSLEAVISSVEGDISEDIVRPELVEEGEDSVVVVRPLENIFILVNQLSRQTETEKWES